MPIKLSEFLAKEKTISLDYLGETVEIRFRVNAFDTEFIETYYGAGWAKEHPGENRLDRQLDALILGWNLVDDDGNAIPPSLAVVEQLPIALKKKLGEAMWQSMEGLGDAEKKS